MQVEVDHYGFPSSPLGSFPSGADKPISHPPATPDKSASGMAIGLFNYSVPLWEDPHWGGRAQERPDHPVGLRNDT